MYHDDTFLDVEDFDEDIRRRKELIEQAKQVAAAEDQSTVNRDLLRLKRQWKAISYRDSAYENELNEEFEAILDTLYGKRNEGFAGNKEIKEALIEQAKQLTESDNFQAATKQMNDLMEQWRTVGTSGKQSDDELWDAFNETRKHFFERKRAYWAQLQERFAHAKEVKEGLIQQAKTYVDSSDWQKTSNALQKLMNEWKAVGSAGREEEDRLWQEFNEYRQAFYTRRNAYYETLHEEQKEKYEQKKALVAQAVEVLEQAVFTKEQTETMKQLGVQWKQIGSCGKTHEDEIWNEFRGVMDRYFAALKEHNEQRHLQWRERLMQMKNRKAELIQDQKRQIKRMEHEIIGLLGERAIADMEDRIEDKEAFIAELEAEIEELEIKLNEDGKKRTPSEPSKPDATEQADVAQNQNESEEMVENETEDGDTSVNEEPIEE